MNELAIVILHHNSPDDVTLNLQRLESADLPEKTEIVVVNNGGHDANAKISQNKFKKYPVRYYEIENQGFPQGNNFGIARTNAQYIAMVNPDIEVEKNTLKTLLDYMKHNKNIGITAPRLIYPTGKIQDNYRVFPRPFDLIVKRIPVLRRMFLGRMRLYLMWEKDPDKNEAVDWVTGAFQVIKKECWDQVGPNNQEYFLFMSDVEICRDAWEKGWEVHFVGKSKAKHNESRLSEGGIKDIFTKKTMRIHIKDAFTYFKKNLFKKIPRECPSAKHT